MSAHTDYETRLREALHAAADSLEPRGDGLERIRTRLRQPRSATARLRAICTEIIMRAPTWLQDAIYQVAAWLRLVSERFAPAQAAGKHRSRAQGLLRPAAAMAVVMFIVAAGTYVAIDASTAIFPSSSSNAPPSGGPNTTGHSSVAPSRTSGGGSVTGTGSHPATSPSCRPTSAKSGQTTPAVPPPAPSASANPSPTAAASPDPSSSPAGGSSTDPSAPASPGPSAPASPNTQPSQPASTPPAAKTC